MKRKVPSGSNLQMGFKETFPISVIFRQHSEKYRKISVLVRINISQNSSIGNIQCGVPGGAGGYTQLQSVPTEALREPHMMSVPCWSRSHSCWKFLPVHSNVSELIAQSQIPNLLNGLTCKPRSKLSIKVLSLIVTILNNSFPPLTENTSAIRLVLSMKGRTWICVFGGLWKSLSLCIPEISYEDMLGSSLLLAVQTTSMQILII